jgi:hypothetical protein
VGVGSYHGTISRRGISMLRARGMANPTTGGDIAGLITFFYARF